MTPLTVVLGAFAVGLILMALVWGGSGLVVALPVAAVLLGIAAWMDRRRRHATTGGQALQRERQGADPQPVEFTERDRETLYTGERRS